MCCYLNKWNTEMYYFRADMKHLSEKSPVCCDYGGLFSMSLSSAFEREVHGRLQYERLEEEGIKCWPKENRLSRKENSKRKKEGEKESLEEKRGRKYLSVKEEKIEKENERTSQEEEEGRKTNVRR